MEKKISLEMLESKDIEIKVNEEKKHIIRKEKRIIRADDIYNVINYSNGDTYEIEGINRHVIDAPVLKFFVELFQEIVKGIPDSDILAKALCFDEDSGEYNDIGDNLPL